MTEVIQVRLTRWGNYHIKGRHNRYDGMTLWQTLECAECPHLVRRFNIKVDKTQYPTMPFSACGKNVIGICNFGVAWKLVVKNRPGRSLRRCVKLGPHPHDTLRHCACGTKLPRTNGNKAATKCRKCSSRENGKLGGRPEREL